MILKKLPKYIIQISFNTDYDDFFHMNSTNMRIPLAGRGKGDMVSFNIFSLFHVPR